MVATSPAHQKALDAKRAMETSKAACAKVPKPGLPHYTWAKNSEIKGAQALDSKDWPKAEKAYVDAKLFYDQAAGKK